MNSVVALSTARNECTDNITYCLELFSWQHQLLLGINSLISIVLNLFANTVKPPNSGPPEYRTCLEQRTKKCLVPNVTIFVDLPPNSKFFKTRTCPLFRGFTVVLTTVWNEFSDKILSFDMNHLLTLGGNNIVMLGSSGQNGGASN